MTIVRRRIKIELNNNNLRIQKNTFSLDLYDYVNSSISLFSPLEFKIGSKYKQYSNKKNYSYIVTFNISTNSDLLCEYNNMLPQLCLLFS